MRPQTLSHARGALQLNRCLVMGIVNRTPDSFYDGGRMGLEESVRHALALVEEGADLLDLGGVKAGPGPLVSEDEETARVVPLVQAVARRTEVPISVETARPAVARRAVEAGAAIINDVSALEDPTLAEVAAETGAALVLMHNGGQIRGRPRHPRYEDVTAAVLAELRRLEDIAVSAGVARDCIVYDAGLDFGKNTYHSLEIVRRTREVVSTGRPYLVAPSRKDVVGETLDVPVEDRLEGTLALVAISAWEGAAIVRVHDVAGAVRTVRMVEAVKGSVPPVAPVRGLWE
ncbi:MAG TPA: dihydropteroate synthase [Actinomycetota bacterium]|nr:dihydropteroate synthase [Actinomycetota bacterium]